MKILVSFLFTAILLFQSFSHANGFSDEGMSRESLVESLKKNTSLNQEQIDQLILSLQQAFKVEPGEKIPVRGYLYAAGMNGALLFDHDVWLFDAVLSVPGVSEPVKVPELFVCDFHNGGLKFEVAYKWMFSFIPSGVTVNELHGGLYGRGLGLVAEAFLGLEGSWLPAKNRPHDLFHVAIKLGFGGGVVFPKMEFKLRNISGDAATGKY